MLVTGGAGYVGSHVALSLAAAGHEPVLADDFSNAHRSVPHSLSSILDRSIETHEIDLTSEYDTDRLFAEGGFEAVVHCAGRKSVSESVAFPIEYYRNNVVSTLSVVSAMRRHDVDRLVFSSSATVYGAVAVAPFREDHEPLESSNPYGQTKVVIERILADVARASEGMKIALLRYFNPIGAHESALIGDDPRGAPNNLMPYIVQVAAGRRSHLTIHGDDYRTSDGTGERDYIHVVDLADGHVAALDHLHAMQSAVRAFNLGTGRPTSVLELVRAFEAASGRQVPFEIGPRRPGDVGVAYADPSRAKAELGWLARRSVMQMCTDSWRWQVRNGRQPLANK